MKISKTLYVTNRDDWRAWLKKHHASSPGVWFVFYKAHTGKTSVPYEDTVREALCFGWIDSLVKRLDDDRYAVKVTPRQPTSKWSGINRRRWMELKAAGLLTSAGCPPSWARSSPAASRCRARSCSARAGAALPSGTPGTSRDRPSARRPPCAAGARTCRSCG